MENLKVKYTELLKRKTSNIFKELLSESMTIVKKKWQAS